MRQQGKPSGFLCREDRETLDNAAAAADLATVRAKLRELQAYLSEKYDVAHGCWAEGDDPISDDIWKARYEAFSEVMGQLAALGLAQEAGE